MIRTRCACVNVAVGLDCCVATTHHGGERVLYILLCCCALCSHARGLRRVRDVVGIAVRRMYGDGAKEHDSRVRGLVKTLQTIQSGAARTVRSQPPKDYPAICRRYGLATCRCDRSRLSVPQGCLVSNHDWVALRQALARLHVPAWSDLPKAGKAMSSANTSPIRKTEYASFGWTDNASLPH